MANNSVRKLFIHVLLLTLLLVACSAPNVVSASEISKVAEKFNCICGSCDLLVADCDCERAIELTDVIKQRLSKGQPEQQIIQDLLRQYGQRVLATQSSG